ncbi:retrovirus-related pol polyprotein from transposon TNT 1-94, partial [Trifolium medium]|nr:retrovirus-related pol polyprotein from transposon TNT 1-94 [Trifolium medium]
DMLEVVNNGVEALPGNPTDAQRTAYREMKKKDCKALFCIHQCVDSKVLKKLQMQRVQKLHETPS